MKCPVCKEPMDYHALVESQLPAYQCRSCQGIWISSNEYLRWLTTHKHPEPPSDIQNDFHDLPTWDSPEVKLCPNCGHFLRRYRIFPNTGYCLDRCGHCNGVWFDRNEWDVLVSRNLYTKLNQFFTQPWQSHIQEEETRQALEQLYLEKFGAEDYSRIREIRGWLEAHPLRGMLLAYLQSKDPYKV